MREKNKRQPVIAVEEWKKIKRALLLLKITGYIWIQEQLPENFDEEIKITFHPPALKVQMADEVKDIKNLGDEGLDFIASNMRSPFWFFVKGANMEIRLGQLADVLSLLIG